MKLLIGIIKKIGKTDKIKIPGRFGKSVTGAKSLKQNIPDAEKVKKIAQKMKKAINKKHREQIINLPEFDGKTTVGALKTPDGKIVYFKSGNPDLRYSNYPAAAHAEGKAALYMRENGIKEGTIYHNNTNGTCGYCDSMLETLLPENAKLNVVPPRNAVANNSRAVATPSSYIGNSNTPKINPRYNNINQ